MKRLLPTIGNFGIAIILVNKENIESKESEVAKIFNDFFSNIVTNLEILEYQCENNNLHNRLSATPVLQAMLEYRNHPSINTICRFSQGNRGFYFSREDKNTVLKEIRKLSNKKAVQETDIPVKVLKENANFFAEQIFL